jgi:hypothetical protein
MTRIEWPRLAALLAAALMLAACAHPAGTAQPASASSATTTGPIRAESPPSDYAVVSSAAGTKIGMNFDAGELPLSLFFGMHFILDVQDAKPAHPPTAGSGTRARDPLRFDPPVAAQDELDTALGWLAGRFPDRSKIEGWLLRSPGEAGTRTYLIYVELESGGAHSAVYIDVTRWAEWRRQSDS